MASIDKFTLLDLIRKVGMEGDVDFLREGLKVLAEALMDAEVSQHIGVERFERCENRKNDRNGYRNREWDTWVGTIGLKIPKCKKAVISPALLNRGDGLKKHCFPSSQMMVSAIVRTIFAQPTQAAAKQQLSPCGSPAGRTVSQSDGGTETGRRRRLSLYGVSS